MAKECPSTQQLCYECKKPGHLAADCPLKKGRNYFAVDNSTEQARNLWSYVVTEVTDKDGEDSGQESGVDLPTMASATVHYVSSAVASSAPEEHSVSKDNADSVSPAMETLLETVSGSPSMSPAMETYLVTAPAPVHCSWCYPHT